MVGRGGGDRTRTPFEFTMDLRWSGRSWDVTALLLANDLALSSSSAAFYRLDNSLSACTPTKSTVWNVG